MAARIMGQNQGPGPMPVPPGQVPQASVPGPGAGPPQPQGPPHPATQPPPGAPLPGEGPGGEGGDLSPSQIEILQDILKDPKAKREVQKIIDQMGGRTKAGALEIIDPRIKTIIAQEWNARKRMMGQQLTQLRGLAPGASKASDEALLTVYWATPSNLELEDIEDYANVVRVSLMTQGWDDIDQIEDRTLQECFPLRLSLVKNGRPFWEDQVKFVRDMNDLTDRWLDQYGKLPRPDYKVQEATEAGHGNPESQPRDTDSEALPPGDQRYAHTNEMR